jgi:hypothetical protein
MNCLLFFRIFGFQPSVYKTETEIRYLTYLQLRQEYAAQL